MTKASRRFRPGGIGALEQRLVMSASIQLSHGVLTINGDSGSDVVTVSLSQPPGTGFYLVNPTQVVVQLSSTPTNGFYLVNPTTTLSRNYSPSDVKSIVFRGSTGNDAFYNFTKITATAFGGTGQNNGFSSPRTHFSNFQSAYISGVPTGNPQSKNTCGPNSAWRVINTLGGTTSLQSVIDGATQNSIVSRWNLGTTGSTLVDAMNSLRRGLGSTTFSLKTKSSLGTIIDSLNQGLPVVAMIRVGGQDVYNVSGGVGGELGKLLGGVTSYSVPALHWIAVTGYDQTKGQLFFTDTNGGSYSYSYNSFNSIFNWNFGTLTNSIFQGLGIVNGTIIVPNV